MMRRRLAAVLRGDVLPLTPRECWAVEQQLNPAVLPFAEWLERLEKPRPLIAPTPPLPPAIKPTQRLVTVLREQNAEERKRRIASDAALLYPWGSPQFYAYIDNHSAPATTDPPGQANGGSPQ